MCWKFLPLFIYFFVWNLNEINVVVYESERGKTLEGDRFGLDFILVVMVVYSYGSDENC